MLSLKKLILRTILALTVLSGLVFLGLLFLFWGHLNLFKLSKESVAQIASYSPPDNSLVLSRSGETIGELYTSYHVYKKFSEIPKELVNAIVAVEDKSFWTHMGFDPVGILRAGWINFSKGSGKYVQGASTLTQQIVRTFLLSKERSLDRKLKEIILSVELEKTMAKEEIFEIYANMFFLGHGAYGVGAAARRYFNKDLDELGLHEIAFIAGLFQAPGRLGGLRDKEAVKRRQSQVVQAMLRNGYLSQEQASEVQAKKLVFRRPDPKSNDLAPFFIDYVTLEAQKLLGLETVKNLGLRIYTTLDKGEQEKLSDAFRASEPLFVSYEAKVRGQNERIEAASVAIDPKSGAILAMVGGRDYRSSQFNRVTQAARQPGSLFKVVVYSLALSQGYKWSDTFYVAPINLDGEYRPRSMSSEYMKETTLLRAFYRSINAPTMELGQSLGVLRVIDHARALGIQSSLKNELGTLLGSSELSMLELATVYGVFANRGFRAKPFGIEKIEDAKGKELYRHQPDEPLAVISPEVAFLLKEGMRQVLLRGTAHDAQSLASFAVGKSGTSNQAKDNWFAGFTDNVLCIVWSGTDTPRPILNASGSSLALPIWQRYMKHLGNGKIAQNTSQVPQGISRLNIDPVYGKVSEEGIPMWFLDSHKPSAQANERIYKIDSQFRDPFSPLPPK